jgi:hypothetical protein
LNNLPDGMILAQEIVVSSIFLVTEFLAIKEHMFYGTFLHVTFRS